MLSLLNAGYEKREIKEAAIELRRKNYYSFKESESNKTIPLKQNLMMKPKKFSKPSSHSLKLPPLNKNPKSIKQKIKLSPAVKKKEPQKQRVSAYPLEKPKEKKYRKITQNVFLVFIICLLSFVALGILILVLAFRGQIWNFLKTLF